MSHLKQQLLVKNEAAAVLPNWVDQLFAHWVKQFFLHCFKVACWILKEQCKLYLSILSHISLLVWLHHTSAAHPLVLGYRSSIYITSANQPAHSGKVAAWETVEKGSRAWFRRDERGSWLSSNIYYGQARVCVFASHGLAQDQGFPLHWMASHNSLIHSTKI